jgi:pimeloyl-ACP methyl ester carboxylesterase
MGACVALQTAVSHPDRVLSLFMLSPLPLIEVRTFLLLLGI